MQGHHAAATPGQPAQPVKLVPPHLAHGSHGHRLAEFTLFLMMIYLFQFFTPEIEQIDLEAAEFAVEAAQSNTFNQIFWLAMSGLLSLLILRQPSRFFQMILGYLPLLVLLAHVIASSSWAVAPGISFRRAALALIIVYSFVVVAIYVRSPRRIFFIVYAAFWVLLAQSIVAAALPSSYTDLNEFRGFQNHKNTMGALCGYAIITGIFIHRHLPSSLLQVLNVGFVAAFGALLFLAQSKTAQQEVILVPVLALIAYTLSRFLKVSVGTVLLAIVVGIVFVFWITVTGFGIDQDDVLALVTADVTFTQRTIIWEYVWDKASERWLLGYGHQSFWAIGLMSVNLTAPVEFVRGLNQAHNGFLDVWLMLGLVGIILFVPIFGSFDRALRIARDSHPQTHNIAWGLMIYALIHNLTESTILQGQNVPWAIMVLVFVAAARARRDHDRVEEAMRFAVPLPMAGPAPGGASPPDSEPRGPAPSVARA